MCDYKIAHRTLSSFRKIFIVTIPLETINLQGPGLQHSACNLGTGLILDDNVPLQHLDRFFLTPIFYLICSRALSWS
jgi:hypothetical protein